jgi:hypothetical protein
MSEQWQGELFEAEANLPPAPPPAAAVVASGVARVLRPNRTQLELRPCD